MTKTIRGKKLTKILAILLVPVTTVIGIHFYIQSVNADCHTVTYVGPDGTTVTKTECSGGGGDTGNNDDVTLNQEAHSDNTWNYTKRGAFWVRIPVDSDDIPITAFGFTKLFKPSDHITNCATGGGAVYILVHRLKQHGFATGTPMRQVIALHGHIEDYDGQGTDPIGGEGVTENEAKTAFRNHREMLISFHGDDYNDSSSLYWFCADAVKTKKEEVKVDFDPIVTCFDQVYAGDTETRIAVVNWTLDEEFVNPNKKRNKKGEIDAYMDLSLSRDSNRYGLETDSAYVRGEKDVMTLAKPGDSIQFLHGACFGARHTREANPDMQAEKKGNAYVDRQSLEWINKLGKQNFEIGSPEEKYLFGNNIGIINSQKTIQYYDGERPAKDYKNGGSDIRDQGKYILDKIKDQNNLSEGRFIETAAGKWADRFEIVSPSLNNNSYECTGYMQYAQFFRNNSYQIPGFTQVPTAAVGYANCGSYAATGISDTVGKTIEQNHKFDDVAVWEKWTHPEDGGCGCNNSSAYQGNNQPHDDVYPFAFREDQMGFRRFMEKGYRDQYKCDTTKTEKDCDCPVKIEEGERWSDKEQKMVHYRDEITLWDQCEHTNYPYLDQGKNGTYFRYQTVIDNKGEKTKTAKVYIPYNFQTSTGSSIEDVLVVYQGGSVKSSFDWSVDARANEYTSNDIAYATYTPSTTIEAYEFLLPPNTSSVPEGSPEVEAGSGASAVCGYYGGSNCNKIAEDGGVKNPYGKYGGDNGSLSADRAVPDNRELVGWKYCVALGFYPSDSHDYGKYDDGRENYELWQQYNGGRGGALDAGELWNVSNASCRTIAKKPNFQVWNGGIYTEGSIFTSVTKKMVGTASANYDSNATTLFGSWEEFAIIAGEESTGIGSAATLGYGAGYKFNLNPSGNSSTKTGRELNKELSKMTVSIENDNNWAGKSGVNASTSINMNLARLRSRYKYKAMSYKEEMKVQESEKNKVHTYGTGMQFVYTDGNLSISSLTKGRVANTKAAQTIENTLGLGSNLRKSLCRGGDACESMDNTLVIVVEGTLTIDKNICLSISEQNCNLDATKLSTYSDVRTKAPSSLPQIIIFANNINIKENVTRIDAWLIAGENGSINTCDSFVKGGKEDGSSFRKCNKTLVINGPVYAGFIDLNRTAGAHHGWGTEDSNNVLERSLGDIGNESQDNEKGSIAPAEIFNLRADTYIWAYNQAQRYSEAVVTYMRELAPRY